jgi:hypothetical protein
MRTKYRLLSFLLALILPLLACTRAMAQDSNKKNWGSEYGVFGGILLPYLIYGVEEIQPFLGLRAALPLNFGAVEAEAASSNAKGVSYQMAALSFRGEITPVPDVSTIFYLGPDFHYYRGMWDPGHYTAWGFHVGTGVLLHISGPLYGRMDMRFNSNPGTSLYLNFGFTIRTALGDGGS